MNLKGSVDLSYSGDFQKIPRFLIIVMFGQAPRVGVSEVPASPRRQLGHREKFLNPNCGLAGQNLGFLRSRGFFPDPKFLADPLDPADTLSGTSGPRRFPDPL